ncbi:MAG: hypothetical protein IIY84_00865, partial [Eubacterium sp.]|nr:hypothetical protein [Eubacterium sp.]
MKTTWRKLLVLMLSLAMVLSYAVPSFALTEGEPAEETEETETAEPAEETEENETAEPAEEAEETEAAEPMEETEAPVLKAASESSVTYSVSIEDAFGVILPGQSVEKTLDIEYWSEEADGWVQGLREGDILEIALHEPINGVDFIQNDNSLTISVAADAALPETAEVLMNGLSLMFDVDIQSGGEYIYQDTLVGAKLKPYEYDLRYLIGGEAAEDDNCYAMAGSTLVIQPALYKVTANGEEQVTEGVTWQAADGSDVTDNGDGTWSHVKPDTGGDSYSIAILPQFNAPDGNSMSVNQYLWIMEPKYVKILRDGDWDIWSDDTNYVVYMDMLGQEIGYDQVQWIITLERDGEVIGTAPKTCYTAVEEDGVSKVRIDATAIDGWKALEDYDVLCIEVRLLKNGTVVAGNIAGAAGQA